MIFDVAVKGAHARKCFALFGSSSGCVCCYFPVRHDNKQLINSLAESIKAQGKSMKSAPASSSRSSKLGGFCRACLRYKRLSQSVVDRSMPCLSRALSQHSGTVAVPEHLSLHPRSSPRVHHPEGRGSPTACPSQKTTPYPMPGAPQGHIAWRVPCGEPQPWDSEGKCHMVMLQVERPNHLVDR